MRDYYIADEHFNVGTAAGIETIEEARLYAHADDLLAALEALLSRYEEQQEQLTSEFGADGAPDPEPAAARAVIAKVRGLHP